MKNQNTRPRKALFTVFLAVLIDLMGFGIVLPLLPFYASVFNASPIQIGLLYSVYSFAQLIFSPFWGNLSDRVGRRPVMLVSTLGAALAYLLFAFSNSLALLFISRILAGVMGGNISTAQAYVADVTTHEDRAKGMGLIGAAFGIGFVAGPAISAILIHSSVIDFLGMGHIHKYAIPGFFASGLSLASFFLVLTRLPETVVPHTHPADDAERVMKMGVWTIAFWRGILNQKEAGAHRLFPRLILSMFLYSFAQASLYSAFPLFCHRRLGLRPEHVGFLFVAMGLVSIAIQGGMIKSLARKFGERGLFLAGSFLMTLGLGFIPLAPSWPLLLVFLCVMSVGGSLMGPTLTSLISKTADPKRVGSQMGISQGMASLGRVIGPAWGGVLYGVGFWWPFLATAGFLAVTIGVGMGLARNGRR